MRRGGRERSARQRVRDEIERVTGDLEPITDHDLRVIKLALGDRIIRHGAGSPAGVAADQVLDKIRRNEERAREAAG